MVLVTLSKKTNKEKKEIVDWELMMFKIMKYK